MNQLENCQARYRSNTWMGRTRTDGPDEFEPTKFDCSLLKMTLLKHFIRFPIKKFTESQVTTNEVVKTAEIAPLQ